MAYGKQYQEVVAGRVRETERIGFFKDNKIVGTGRTVTLAPTGGKTQPTIDKDFLGTEWVGKAENRDKPALHVYLPNAYNAAQ